MQMKCIINTHLSCNPSPDLTAMRKIRSQACVSPLGYTYCSLLTGRQRNADDKSARLQSIYTNKLKTIDPVYHHCHTLRDVVPLVECTIPLAGVHFRRRLCLIDQ